MNRLADLFSPSKFESFPLLPLAGAALIAGLVLLLAFGRYGPQIESARPMLYDNHHPEWSEIAPMQDWLLAPTKLYHRDLQTSQDVNGRPRGENIAHLSQMFAQQLGEVSPYDLLLLRELLNDKRIGNRNARVVGGYFLLAGLLLLLLVLYNGLFGDMRLAPPVPAAHAADKGKRKNPKKK
ncbi:MAG: hypothetical protein P9M14_01815 [Candidatus Alcyoniella australis]|nr:hypothetical protein [Candidatus Alcyoniella australis]